MLDIGFQLLGSKNAMCVVWYGECCLCWLTSGKPDDFLLPEQVCSPDSPFGICLLHVLETISEVTKFVEHEPE